jgi:hypothetical protein
MLCIVRVGRSSVRREGEREQIILAKRASPTLTHRGIEMSSTRVLAFELIELGVRFPGAAVSVALMLFFSMFFGRLVK